MKALKVNWRQAATEFVVVVVGVLVALAVDQWRDEYEDRRTETEYLHRLLVDIEADVENFRAFEQILEAKAQFLQSLLDGTTMAEFGRDAESLMEAITYSSFKGLPDSVSTTFDELQTTGRLALVQDVKKRDALSKYYSGFEHMSTILAQPSGDYRRALWATVPGTIFREWRLSRTIAGIDELRRSLELLQNRTELYSVVNSEITYATALQFYLVTYREQAENLIELLSQ